MEFVTLFDVVVVSLVLILGIKGVISGLIKEIFGLVGLIGGIVVASRFAAKAGQIISDKVYKLDGDTVVFCRVFINAHRFLGRLLGHRRIFIKTSRSKRTWVFR